ncbi:MAG: XrtA-associated tyrosine autokinase [Gammaproteobacteria bacterium]|jgi:receptor protein-tyrosine kinase|nr:XrtA-associated tyrosine autokinase [Gammaproteobacteria bacterium]
MSIIEKAVDRLDGGEARSRAPAPPPLHRDLPVDALEAEIEREAARSPASAAVRSVDVPVGVEPTRRSREVALDMARLQNAGVLTPGDTDGQLAEECRLIKRPLLVHAFGETTAANPRRNLVMVTSSLPGEGKTFVSLSLAMSMASELDRTVLLVDGDVVRGSVSELLGLSGGRGLTELLAGEVADVGDVLVRTDVPKLVVLPAGNPHPQSTELLASESMHRLADDLSLRYPDRIVIFDSPPLLAASGATVLARVVGQIVLVVEAERTAQSAVKESLRLLKGLPVAGVMLNKARERWWSRFGYGYGSGYGYRYGYRYGYGSDKQAQAQADVR